MHKDYIDLMLPFESADNYYNNRQKGNIDSFIYIEPSWFSKLLSPSTYYILGSKGSGKTLFAAYMCAAKRNNTISKSYTIDVGDYGKLIAMKTKNHLEFTDYTTMWTVVLLQKFLFGIDTSEITWWKRTKSFSELKATISSYFGYDVADDSFNPVTVIDSYGKQTEVTTYLQSQTSFSTDYLPIKAESSSEGKNEEKVQNAIDQKIERVSTVYTDTWMRSINEFRKTITCISFNCNHYLFVDGLDVRPKGIDPKEYGECIGALIRAVYNINTKIFGNLQRRDNHEFKIIALTRTDIFLNSDLVNVTGCINDNSVELDWTYSNEREFKYSSLFRMMNRVLEWDSSDSSYPIDYYFNFSVSGYSRYSITAPMFIQRQSRLRPRDIVVMFKLIQNECINRGLKNPNQNVLSSQSFISNYSNYYAEQIKSEMSFKYTPEETKLVFQLIKSIRCEVFKEDYFQAVFSNFAQSKPEITSLFSDYTKVLDVLYSLDIIGWREIYKTRPKVHWHYREVKAIDEVYGLPWEQIRVANRVSFVIHRGASKHILGTIQ